VLILRVHISRVLFHVIWAGKGSEEISIAQIRTESSRDRVNNSQEKEWKTRVSGNK
jgi:hypothetical protein